MAEKFDTPQSVQAAMDSDTSPYTRGLCVLVSNYFSLGQWELGRIVLSHLHELDAAGALRLLHTLVGSGVPGSWFSSDSVPSPAHLAWLALGHLHTGLDGSAAIPSIKVCMLGEVQIVLHCENALNTPRVELPRYH